MGVFQRRRHRAGSPVGGRFAASTRASADAVLTDPEAEAADARLRLRRERVRAAPVYREVMAAAIGTTMPDVDSLDVQISTRTSPPNVSVTAVGRRDGVADDGTLAAQLQGHLDNINPAFFAEYTAITRSSTARFEPYRDRGAPSTPEELAARMRQSRARLRDAEQQAASAYRRLINDELSATAPEVETVIINVEQDGQPQVIEAAGEGGYRSQDILELARAAIGNIEPWVLRDYAAATHNHRLVLTQHSETGQREAA